MFNLHYWLYSGFALLEKENISSLANEKNNNMEASWFFRAGSASRSSYDSAAVASFGFIFIDKTVQDAEQIH